MNMTLIEYTIQLKQSDIIKLRILHGESGFKKIIKNMQKIAVKQETSCYVLLFISILSLIIENETQ